MVAIRLTAGKTAARQWLLWSIRGREQNPKGQWIKAHQELFSE